MSPNRGSCPEQLNVSVEWYRQAMHLGTAEQRILNVVCCIDHKICVHVQTYDACDQNRTYVINCYYVCYSIYQGVLYVDVEQPVLT